MVTTYGGEILVCISGKVEGNESVMRLLWEDPDDPEGFVILKIFRLDETDQPRIACEYKDRRAVMQNAPDDRPGRFRI